MEDNNKMVEDSQIEEDIRSKIKRRDKKALSKKRRFPFSRPSVDPALIQYSALLAMQEQSVATPLSTDVAAPPAMQSRDHQLPNVESPLPNVSIPMLSIEKKQETQGVETPSEPPISEPIGVRPKMTDLLSTQEMPCSQADSMSLSVDSMKGLPLGPLVSTATIPEVSPLSISVPAPLSLPIESQEPILELAIPVFSSTVEVHVLSMEPLLLEGAPVFALKLEVNGVQKIFNVAISSEQLPQDFARAALHVTPAELIVQVLQTLRAQIPGAWDPIPVSESLNKYVSNVGPLLKIFRELLAQEEQFWKDHEFPYGKMMLPVWSD